MPTQLDRLVIERQINGKKTDLNGGEFSCRLKGAQSKWTQMEKECLAITTSSHTSVKMSMLLLSSQITLFRFMPGKQSK